MKKISVIFFLIILLILSGCDDSVPKDKVFSYVKENHEILAEFPIDEIPRDFKEEKKFIKETLGRDTIVKGVHEYKKGIIRFSCGGSGLVTGSTYVGFYYSENNEPYAMEFNSHKLTEIEEGVFYWNKGDDSETFYTERIMDNWFYYKMEWY